jgi:hypothetical protein
MRRVAGAQGRNRTSDTAIFNRMLYQLSYLGISRAERIRPAESRAVIMSRQLACPDREMKA